MLYFCVVAYQDSGDSNPEFSPSSRNLLQNDFQGSSVLALSTRILLWHHFVGHKMLVFVITHIIHTSAISRTKYSVFRRQGVVRPVLKITIPFDTV